MVLLKKNISILEHHKMLGFSNTFMRSGMDLLTGCAPGPGLGLLNNRLIYLSLGLVPFHPCLVLYFWGSSEKDSVCCSQELVISDLTLHRLLLFVGD